jgi:biotin carboxylase
LLATADGRAVRHRVCHGVADLRAFAAEVGLPVVVKPTTGAGSRGVCSAAEPDGLDAAYRHAAQARADGGAVLAEELLTGPEFSVETLSRAGVHEVLMVTEKRTTGRPHFIEIGHVVPARVDPGTADRLASEAVRALTAIGHRDGLCHVELISCAWGPAVVEINRRVSGDRIWELVMLAADRNMVAEALRAVLGTGTIHGTGGERTWRPGASPRGAAIRYLVADRTLRRDSPTAVGPDPLAGVPGVIRYHLAPADHEIEVPVTTSSSGRLGYVLAVGPTAAAAAAAAEAGHDALAERLFGDAHRRPVPTATPAAAGPEPT